MNMRTIVKRFLLKRAVFILLLCSVYSSYAQDLFTISGRIVDENNAAFEFATVSLKIQDSLAVASVITDSEGCFQLNNINRGKYKLSVSFFLQELYSQDVEVDNNINLNTIVVSAGITLNETRQYSLTASLSKSYKNWNIAVGAYDLARSNVTLKENRTEYSFCKYNRYFKTYYVNLRYSFGKQKVKQIYDKQSDIDRRL